MKKGGKETEKEKDNYIKRTAFQLSEYIKNNKIDFLGFKLWSGEGFYGSLKLASAVKKLVNIPIFGGGPQVDWFGQYIFKATSDFEALAYGEGEETIVRFAEYVEEKLELGQIPGILYKAKESIVRTPKKLIETFSSIPLPVYDVEVYPAIKGNNKIKMVSFEECRGCPNSCNFCVHPRKSGKKWRTKDASLVVDDLEKLVSKYNMRVFKFTGSNPPIRNKLEIAKEIIKRGLKIKYSAFAHVKGMDRDDYKILKQSGCQALLYGVESGSDKILKESANKNFNGSDIEKAVKDCQSAGIAFLASIIVPQPFETETTLQETVDVLKRAKPDLVFVSAPILEPESSWSINNEKFGFEIKNREELFYKEMIYTMKYSYPVLLWDDIAEYKLNGKTLKEMFLQAEGFTRRLSQEGLSSFGSDDMYLLSNSMNTDMRAVLSEVQESLSMADHEKMQELANNINERIK